jgi:hypothetical protein
MCHVGNNEAHLKQTRVVVSREAVRNFLLVLNKRIFAMIIFSRKMRWAGHITCKSEITN